MFKVFDHGEGGPWGDVPDKLDLDTYIERKFKYYQFLNKLYNNRQRRIFVEAWSADSEMIMVYVYHFSQDDVNGSRLEDYMECMLQSQAIDRYNHVPAKENPRGR